MPVVELIIALTASEGRMEELRDALQILRKAGIQDPGCLDYRIAQGSLLENRFFLLGRWTDEGALFRYEHTQDFLEGVARVRTCCEFVDFQPINLLE
ncbi:TPA: putative quinol monooxygenase [Pseudomonas aeruginosa]